MKRRDNLVAMSTGAVGFLVLCLSASGGEEEGQDKQPAAAEQQYRALLKEYDDAFQAYSRAFREAKTPQDREKVIHEKYPRPEECASKLLRLVEEHPGEPFAEEALIWILTNQYELSRFRPWYEHTARYEQIWIATSGGRRFGVPSNEEQQIRGKATEMLLRDHFASPQLGRVVELLGFSQDKKSVALCRAILEKNPSNEVKAEAAVALARQMQARVAVAKQLKDNPELARTVEQTHGKDYAEELEKLDPVKLEAEADQLYAELIEKYLPAMKPASIAILCQHLYYTSESEGLLRALYTKDKRDEVRGVACLVLGQVRMRNAESLTSSDAVAAAKLHKEGEDLLEEAAEKYAGVQTAFDGTVGRKAKSELFDRRRLAVGKAAPEVEGVDQYGKRFKLSDYRGKVVLLDFWSEF